MGNAVLDAVRNNLTLETMEKKKNWFCGGGGSSTQDDGESGSAERVCCLQTLGGRGGGNGAKTCSNPGGFARSEKKGRRASDRA